MSRGCAAPAGHQSDGFPGRREAAQIPQIGDVWSAPKPRKSCRMVLSTGRGAYEAKTDVCFWSVWELVEPDAPCIVGPGMPGFGLHPGDTGSWVWWVAVLSVPLTTPLVEFKEPEPGSAALGGPLV